MKKLSTSFGHHLSNTRYYQSQLLSCDEKQQQNVTTTTSVSEDSIFDKEGFNMCQIIGNINKAFIICAFNCNIYLVDQHAASQKSLYVRFLRQKNLLPEAYQGQSFQIENIYKEILLQQKQTFKKLGWSFNILKQGPIFFTINLTSVPSILNKKCRQVQFLEILENYYQKSMEELSKTQKQTMATFACHNAYRIGDQLNRQEMRRLIDTLYEMPGAYNCPHSRPVIIMLGQVQKFKNSIHQKRQYNLF